MKRYISICVLALIAAMAWSQELTVHGTVVDGSHDNEPMIGANIMIKGTTQGTITDLDGNFTLKCASKAVLVVSSMGYKTEEISVNGKSTLSITLKEDAEVLDEVVVVGYGTQRKSSLTSAVSAIL